MGTAIAGSARPRCRDFVFGVALGFATALVLPARRRTAEPVRPPAPRPLEVPVWAPHEEPVPVRLRRAA